MSGSLRERPARRLRELTVFLRLEISWVFAVSPRYLVLGPKPTRELLAVSYYTISMSMTDTDGVARFETSFVICIAVSQQNHEGLLQVDGINIRHPRLDSARQR